VWLCSAAPLSNFVHRVPDSIKQPLAESLSASKQDPPERRHLRMQQVLTEAALAGSVPSTFLNLIGLLNLLDQHSMSNGTSASQLAATFASEFLENRGAHLKQYSKEWREATQKATTVLTSLISNIYVMFPPQGAQLSATSSSSSKQNDPPATVQPKAEQIQSSVKNEKEKQSATTGDSSHAGPDEKARIDHLAKEKDSMSDSPLKGASRPSLETARQQDTTTPKSPSTPAADAQNWAVFSADNNAVAKHDFDKDEDKKVVSMLFGDRQEAAASPGATSEDIVVQDHNQDEMASNETGVMEDEEEEEEGEEEEDGVPMDAIAVAKFSYTAGDDDELSFKKGDKIKISWRSSWDEETQEGWYTGHLDGRTGQLPSTYVTIQADNSVDKPPEQPATGGSGDTGPVAASAKAPHVADSAGAGSSEDDQDLSRVAPPSPLYKASPGSVASVAAPASSSSILLPNPYDNDSQSWAAKDMSIPASSKRVSPEHSTNFDGPDKGFMSEEKGGAETSAATPAASGHGTDAEAGRDNSKSASRTPEARGANHQAAESSKSPSRASDSKSPPLSSDNKKAGISDSSARKAASSKSPSTDKSQAQPASSAVSAPANNKTGWLDTDDDDDDNDFDFNLQSNVAKKQQQQQPTQNSSKPADKQQTSRPAQSATSGTPSGPQKQQSAPDRTTKSREPSQPRATKDSRDQSPATRTPVSHSKQPQQKQNEASDRGWSALDDEMGAHAPEDPSLDTAASPNNQKPLLDEETKAKMELLFGKASNKRGPLSDKATKEAWNEVLAWFRKNAGGGSGTSPGGSSRAYPDKILSKVKSADKNRNGSPGTGYRDGGRGRSPAHAQSTQPSHRIVSTYHEPDRTGMTEKAIAQRPWRHPPSHSTSPARRHPRAADPSQYAHSWKRKWHMKILHDGDVRSSHINVDDVMFVNSEDEERGSASVRQSAEGFLEDMDMDEDEGGLEQELEKETQHALEKVHAIRSTQRQRMKMYNQALISVSPPPVHGISSPALRENSRQSSRARSADPPNMGARYTSMQQHAALIPPDEDEYKYWTGNAAYRHVERQRRARMMAELKNQWLPSGHRRNPPKTELDPTRARNPRSLVDSMVVDMSEAFRRAGTADNARRGVKPTGVPLMRHSVHLDRDVASEKFALLEAHLQHPAGDGVPASSLHSAGTHMHAKG
jgi:hypothetical protein